MNEGWVRNIKRNPPPPSVMVSVLVDDYSGECVMRAQRIDYRIPKGKRTWRWCDGRGVALGLCVDAWKLEEVCK